MLSIIWNITNRCPWDCVFCVTDAGESCMRPELTYQEKLQVVKNLQGVDCRIDLSGGEVMLNRTDHLPIIEKLSHMFGKERIGISCSGAFINNSEAEFLAKHIADVEMTMDAHPDVDFLRRPKGYHSTAAKAATKLMAKGVVIGFQTVVTRDHLENPTLFSSLHSWLKEHNVPVWSLIRYFPSGRGVNFPELALSVSENLEIVNYAKVLCAGTGSPKLDIHYLMPGTNKDARCRCVRKSIGILPNGDVTSCFWGLDANGDISNSKFFLGNILQSPLVDILNSNNAKYWLKHSGACPLESDGGVTNVLTA